MEKVIIILSAFALAMSCYGQKPPKKQTGKTETIPVSPPIEEIIEIKEIEDDGWDLIYPKRTTPYRTITVEVIDTVPIRTDIFYYSPRMENKDYPYWQELGSPNNHVGNTTNNRDKVQIPDTCESGAKLIIHAIGYEPLAIDISSIQKEDHISVRLLPKIYNSTIVLIKKRKDRSIVIADYEEYEESAQIFYGNCLTLYGKNGEHGDPLCAFTCLSCYPELESVQIKDYSLKEIYRELKKKKNCSVLLYLKDGMSPIEKVEVEGFSNRKRQNNVQQGMKNSGWYFNKHLIVPKNRFQYRVHFVLYKEQKNTKYKMNSRIKF